MRAFALAFFLLLSACVPPSRADWVIDTDPTSLYIHPGESLSINIYATYTGANSTADVDSYAFTMELTGLGNADLSLMQFVGGVSATFTPPYSPAPTWVFSDTGGSYDYNGAGSYADVSGFGTSTFAAVKGIPYWIGLVTLTASPEAVLGDQYVINFSNFSIRNGENEYQVDYGQVNVTVVPEADVSLLMGVVFASGLGRYAMRKREAMAGWMADFSARRQDKRRGTGGLVGVDVERKI